MRWAVAARKEAVASMMRPRCSLGSCKEHGCRREQESVFKCQHGADVVPDSNSIGHG